MRKIYTLITLLLLCVGATTSAYGQFVFATIDSEPTAADNIETGVYVIKLYAKARTGYVYDNGYTGGVYVSSASNYVNGTDVLSLDMLWKVTKVTTDGVSTYTIRSVKGNYLPVVTSNGSNWNLSSTTPGYYSIDKYDSNYLTNGARVHTGNFYIHCDGSNSDANTDMTLSQWGEKTPDDNISTSISLLSFYKADVSDTAMESIINNYSSWFSGKDFMNYSGYVGAYDATEAWSTFLKDGNFENLNEAIVNASDKVEIQPGKYYQIKNINASNNYTYISSVNNYADTNGDYTNETYITRVASTDLLIVPSLWSFESSTDANGQKQYKLLNANAQKYLGEYAESGWGSDNVPTGGINLSATAGSYYLLPAPDNTSTAPKTKAATWLLSTTYKDETKLRSENTNGDSSYDYVNAFGANTPTIKVVAGYSANHWDDTGNQWYIIPVTSFNFTVNTETHWASAKFPFEVTLPDELTAYTGLEEKNTTLTLQSIDSKVIPANTAVFITSTGTGSVYKLQITSTCASAISDNVLDGTTLTRSGYSRGDLWMLTRNGSDPILKKNSSNISSVKPNKAFYPVSASSDETQESLQIAFGDATGIQNAVDTQSTKNVEYFDLNGRRVLYPTTGIYVTSTGQKVFIK